ncbi:Subtilase family [Clostridium putrefaciens]|uniref:Subtilase family n=2 Tax=Clostridium putrefaciens TaxID=99675 RepID=A0A381JBA4_9CLOT|nr:Subtilase family [Clostridium putrefaciens]
MSNKKRPILAKGEEYIVPHKHDNGFSKGDKRLSFEEARYKLSNQVKDVISCINQTPQEFIMDEVIVNVKMDVDYSAKSYHPNAFIKHINAEDVGSKKWMKEITLKDKTKPNKIKLGKEIFLRMSKITLQTLEEQLRSGDDFSKGAIDNIRSIESIYFDNHSILISKFDADWTDGRVELVLHPFESSTEKAKNQLMKLINQYGGETSKVKFKTYASGITFVSAVLTRETLTHVLRFNPIRTAHPIFLKQLPIIRSSGMGMPLPPPPLNVQQSTIKVGVFDGGVNVNNPYFAGCVIENNPILTPKDNNFLDHGMGVVGAALYGDLSGYGLKDNLATPIINVESFRVFPLSDYNDIDLYEIIDIIEDVVPKRPDINVYNLSIGPYGAIDDDNITRFTYAIDELSKDGKTLFVVAVGNDGDLSDDQLCRIQAPSDAVNCLGIGAYSQKSDGTFERAEYSSYGDGREGCKIKPDFLDFGGSTTNPFQLISGSANGRSFSCGTSFSAPLVTAKAAEIIGRCNFGNPLLARVLLVHTAQHPEYKADRFIGHGFANQKVEDILSCVDNSVTTIYQSKLRPTQAIKLPLPYIGNLNYSGKVVVEWTIALSTEIDAKNTEDYTLSCIEDTFYPSQNKYTMSKTINGKRKTKVVNLASDHDTIEELIADDWRLGNNPNSYSDFSNKYKTEQERKNNFKWDTVIKRRAVMAYKNLKDPYLVLHAMDRYGHDAEFVNYAVAVTMDYIDSTEDVYDLTLKTYNKLEVASIRNVNEILVK